MLMLMMLVPVTDTIRIPPGARKYNDLTGRFFPVSYTVSIQRKHLCKHLFSYMFYTADSATGPLYILFYLGPLKNSTEFVELDGCWNVTMKNTACKLLTSVICVIAWLFFSQKRWILACKNGGNSVSEMKNTNLWRPLNRLWPCLIYLKMYVILSNLRIYFDRNEGIQESVLLWQLGDETCESRGKDGYRRHRSIHVHSSHLFLRQNKRGFSYHRR